VSYLVEKGLVSRTAEGIFDVTPLGQVVLAQLEFSDRQNEYKSIRGRLRERPQPLIHETDDTSAFVAISEDVLGSMAATGGVGQKIAERVLETGGKLVIFYHQEARLRGNIGDRSRDEDARPAAADLVKRYGSERVVRLKCLEPFVADDAHWIRDTIGWFVAEPNCSPDFPRGHYFPFRDDLMEGTSAYFQGDTPQRHADSLRRVQLNLSVAGGFAYPLGDSHVALSEEVLKRPLRNAVTTTEFLTPEVLSDEFAMAGRPELVFLLPLTDRPPHVDTAVVQVGKTVFVPRLGAELAADAPPNLRELARRMQENERRLREAGFEVDTLPIPSPSNPLKTQLHVVNMLQFYSQVGSQVGARHVLVPWLSRSTPAGLVSETRYQAEIIEKLNKAGAATVEFVPFEGLGGALRCLTNHIPAQVVEILKATHHVT